MAFKTTKITIYPLLSILLSLVFIAGYIMNEHFNKINWNSYSNGQYDNHDYLLTEFSEMFIIALLFMLAMLFITKWALKKGAKYRVLPLTAWFFYFLVTVSLLDMTFGSWGIPGRCGDGFSLGNCFLAEGLGELIYYAVIPIGFALGTIFLVINRYINREAKQQSSQAT